MNDRPTAGELLSAVEQLLDEQLIPALDGSRRYNARVAANVVRMVRRELALEEQGLDAEWRGLDVLLGDADPPATLEARRTATARRNEDLSQRIRNGEADAGERRELVVAHVRDVVRAKLEVSNPAWLEEK